jgi:uroporphyrinogen III methyltransferase / synthase
VTNGQSTDRLLQGIRVMVTRPTTGVRDILAEQLWELGAEVITQPAIRIDPPGDWQPVDSAIDRLSEFDWVVFSSANGVRSLTERVKETGRIEQMGRVRLAAIGPGTAEALAIAGLRAAVIPEEFRAEALAESLVREAPARRFLLARASRGREVLAEQLAAAGATVEQIVVYKSTDVERPDAQVMAMLTSGGIDWITVTSSAIARSLARLFGDDLRHARLASISPITSETLRGLGHEPVAEATEYTMAGLVTAIVAIHKPATGGRAT